MRDVDEINLIKSDILGHYYFEDIMNIPISAVDPKVEAEQRLRRVVLESYLRKCQELFSTGIFRQHESPLFQSAVVHLLVLLKELTSMVANEGNRVIFQDDILPSNEVKDVTHLIAVCRNAACHILSKENYIAGDIYSTANTIIGYAPNVWECGGVLRGCDFADDVAFFYGEYRIYLRRHLLRVVNEISCKYPRFHHRPNPISII